ncbi:hypothetical protein [Streptomyces hirsutus]
MEALEAVEAALNGVASSVDLPVESWWSTAATAAVVPVTPLVDILRDGVCDAAFTQVGAEASGAVGLVRDDLIRPAVWPARTGPRDADAFREGACAETVVALARYRRDREGTTAAIAGEVDELGGSVSAFSVSSPASDNVRPVVG